MNTVIDLMDELQAEIGNLIDEMQLFEAEKKLKVYKHDIPINTAFRNDEEKHLPCVVVRNTSGTVAAVDEMQATTIKFYIEFKDESLDMSGSDKLILIIDKLKDYLLSNYGLKNKYTVKMPLKYSVAEDITYPYYLAILTAQFETQHQSYIDADNYL